MAIQITTQTRNFLRGLIGMDDATKVGVLTFYANNNSISLEDLQTAAAEVEASDAEKVKAEAEKAARKAQNEEDKRVRALILACSTLEEVLPHVAYAESRKKRVWVNADGSFATNLKGRKAVGGRGRPAKDAPTGFRSVESEEEILGGIATFVKEQVEADNFDDELLGALYTESGNLRTRDKLIAALLEAGVIEEVESDD